MSKYLIFESPFESPLAGDIGIIIKAKRTNATLGRIEYYLAWQQYVFVPSSGTAWSWECLEDIVEELKKLNEKRGRR